MLRPILALVALASASPALAAPAPTDDIDVSVDTVTAPSPAPGNCMLKGWVVTVRQSDRFKPGSPINVAVPCAAGGNQQGYYDMALVGRTKTVSLKLAGDQVIDWQAIDSDSRR